MSADKGGQRRVTIVCLCVCVCVCVCVCACLCESVIDKVIASKEASESNRHEMPCYLLPLAITSLQTSGVHGTGSTSQITNLSLCPMVMLNMKMVQHQVKVATTWL